MDVSESRIAELARELSELAGQEHTRIFGAGPWMERLVDWTLKDPTFKVQLFRFVDVLPACKSNEDVLTHLDEYLRGVHAPPLLNVGLMVGAHVPLGATVSATVARRNVMRMAQQFIVGTTPEAAMPTLELLWREGEAATVDLLGEKTITNPEADTYVNRAMELLETMSRTTEKWPANALLEADQLGKIPRANVSVKPTALSPRFGPLTRVQGIADALTRLRPLLQRARELDATINLDMEHYDYKDITLELLRAIGAEFPDGPQLGCVIQAYLKDSFTDLSEVTAWSQKALKRPLQIRLVKGAQWDAETITARAEGWQSPVYERKDMTDANYERCARFMVEHAGEIRPAFATHNIRTLSYVLAAAEAADLAQDAFEIQLLYGMAEPLHAAVRSIGRRVRVYAPIGELVPGMAYLVRRLLENTSNESFVRHRFVEGDALGALIRAPSIADDKLPAAPSAQITRSLTSAEKPGSFSNEPLLEFRREYARAAWEEGLHKAQRSLGFEAPVVIDGKASRIEQVIVSVNPGETASVVCRSGRASVQDANRAIETAKQAWPEWRDRSWNDRADVLFRAAQLMRERRAELGGLISLEAGKPPREADADVCEAIDFCEYYGRRAIAMGQGVPILKVPGELNSYFYQPRGVGVVIAPWNFPLAIPTGMVTAALATGNTVCIKPAEQSPGVAWRMFNILLEAGVPKGVLAFLPGMGEEVGAALVEHPDTAFITFTGSKAVGLEIIRQAALTVPGQTQVKKVVAEMGGKNPIIVDSDADLDVAVPGIVQSAFSYAGQKCSAASRVIAVGAIFDELVERLAGATEAVIVGQADDLATTVGPLIDSEALARVQKFQELAKGESKVVTDQVDVPEGGYFVSPMIAVLSDASSKLWTDEIFGPVISVIKAPDFETALQLANNTEYALTAGLYSRLPEHLDIAAKHLRAGNVYLNRPITGAIVGRQPFGGFGLSGVGSKAGGPDYLLQFVEPKVTTENTLRQGFAPDDA